MEDVQQKQAAILCADTRLYIVAGCFVNKVLGFDEVLRSFEDQGSRKVGNAGCHVPPCGGNVWKWRTDLADMLQRVVIPWNRCWERWNEALVILGDRVNIPRCRFPISSLWARLHYAPHIIFPNHSSPTSELWPFRGVSVKTETTCLINWWI